MIEAFWASLDEKRPSGDDPKRVASALKAFYQDLTKQLAHSRIGRWKTPLFRELEPKIQADVRELQRLVTEFADTGSADLDSLRARDESVRTSIFRLQEEESDFGLVPHPSPKINQLNYYFQGWKRGLLEPGPLQQFLKAYSQSLRQTRKEIRSVSLEPGPRETEEETRAIELSLQLLEQLNELVRKLQKQIPMGAATCDAVVKSIGETGIKLGEAFETLEKCSPVTEPCPFCGGQLSLSGRCRGCGRRVPHLEESQEPASVSLESPFLSQNCRKVDLALRAWEAEKNDVELWKSLQQAVRTFGAQIVEGRKSAELLATNPERPIDSQDSLRQKEESLRAIGQVFQDALSTLSKFSRPTEPPSSSIALDWREPLLEAELKLKELQDSLQPEDDS